MNTSARNTAHTLLDFYSGYTGAESDDARTRAFNTSMEKLNHDGAISAELGDQDELSLDVLPLLLASSVSYEWLFSQLTAATGKDAAELSFELRAFIDSLQD
ncbi:hypothetical protein SAMN06295974_1884 [Plantibacter flavus]|uniref:Uncharacterized protein n=1 Tax=Plantibacter flavus TaxID=150123 RepID=A0A3N2BXL5_9MICO|nr:hypothetical protein [Plantibacter flavus]ROR79989.1 hypothetical protein EDD42_0019 [Plantibacter flavus]SMG28262.1 hypothetical protein SAMN06295974_1884 [Plantibacter flavus]